MGTASSLMMVLVGGCSDTGDQLDSDGDGLPDDWELHGVDADGNGSIDLDLPALGADPLHKDVFVELDWMEVPGPDGHSDAWLLGALDRVQQAFLAAPIDNPDGQTGIVLHIDAGPESILDPRTSRRWGADSGGSAIAHETDVTLERVVALRATNQASARLRVFRYGVAAHAYAPMANPFCESEQVATIGAAEFGGPHFVVTHRDPAATAVVLNGFVSGDEGSQAGLFMHEFGHTFGLDHGGADGINRKPNYFSAMNYLFIYRGLRIAGEYGHLDYSRFDGVPLNEATLDESRGLSGLVEDGSVRGTLFYCGGGPTTLCLADLPALAEQMVESADITQAIDWNCSGSIDAAPVASNINIQTPGEQLQTQNDWKALDYTSSGAIGPNRNPVDPRRAALTASRPRRVVYD
jgi:hypothetical protein